MLSTLLALVGLGLVLWSLWLIFPPLLPLGAGLLAVRAAYVLAPDSDEVPS